MLWLTSEGELRHEIGPSQLDVVGSRRNVVWVPVEHRGTRWCTIGQRRYHHRSQRETESNTRTNIEKSATVDSTICTTVPLPPSKECRRRGRMRLWTCSACGYVAARAKTAVGALLLCSHHETVLEETLHHAFATRVHRASCLHCSCVFSHHFVCVWTTCNVSSLRAHLFSPVAITFNDCSLRQKSVEVLSARSLASWFACLHGLNPI